MTDATPTPAEPLPPSTAFLVETRVEFTGEVPYEAARAVLMMLARGASLAEVRAGVRQLYGADLNFVGAGPVRPSAPVGTLLN